MSAVLADPDRLQQLQMLRASALAFSAKESPPSRARALRAEAPGFDLKFWNALAAQGWTGLLVPETAGGYAQGFAEMAEVTAALAAQVAPEPIVPVLVFAGRLLQGCSSHPTARALLADMAAGRALPAVAWQEDATGAGSFDHRGSLAEPAAICAREGSHLVLRGGKRHVRPGAAATGYIVSASSSEGVALVWLPAGCEGLVTSTHRLADGTLGARLQFHEIAVPADHLLAIGPAAGDALAAAYDEALVLSAVELGAISRHMLSMTLDYLRTRKQFGKPIGSFQSMQHRAVDMLIQQELSGALVAHALAALDRGCTGLQRALLAARVKARCSEAALLVARESVQMHGAIGFTDECDLGLYVQRALVLSAWLGNAALQRRRFAQLTRNTAGNREAAE